jgi:predicted nuclease with TOPRIM domain
MRQARGVGRVTVEEAAWLTGGWPPTGTVRILRDIREEVHGLREEQREFREQSFGRFEVIEGTLKDLAEQLVKLAHGVKVAIERRSKTDDRIRKLERRVASLEKPRSA